MQVGVEQACDDVTAHGARRRNSRTASCSDDDDLRRSLKSQDLSSNWQGIATSLCLSVCRFICLPACISNPWPAFGVLFGPTEPPISAGRRRFLWGGEEITRGYNILFLCFEIIKIVATRCHILKLNCTKFDFGWGSAPDPAGAAYSAPSDPLAEFKGVCF